MIIFTSSASTFTQKGFIIRKSGGFILLMETFFNEKDRFSLRSRVEAVAGRGCLVAGQVARSSRWSGGSRRVGNQLRAEGVIHYSEGTVN